MQPINREPFFADFGNSDVDGAIRLITNGTLAEIARLGLSLAEGQRVWLTDNDIEVIATISFRDGKWVAIPDANGYKNVPEDAP